MAPDKLLLDKIRRENIALLHEIGREKDLSEDRIAYLEKVMNKESSGDTFAKPNGRSSATGLFQFTDETWERLVKKHPKDLKMDGRNDPRQQIIAAIYFTDENEKALTPVIGRTPNHGDLYISHFSGKGGGNSGGAIDFFLAAKEDINKPIKGIMSDKAIKANSYKNDKDKGVRITLNEKFLPIEDFAVGDLINWAYAKMGMQPPHKTASESKYRKDEKGIPDAQGNWVMVAVAVAVMAIAAVVTGIGSFFSDDSPSPGNIPHKPRPHSRA